MSAIFGGQRHDGNALLHSPVGPQRRRAFGPSRPPRQCGPGRPGRPGSRTPRLYAPAIAEAVGRDQRDCLRLGRLKQAVHLLHRCAGLRDRRRLLLAQQQVPGVRRDGGEDDGHGGVFLEGPEAPRRAAPHRASLVPRSAGSPRSRGIRMPDGGPHGGRFRTDTRRPG